MNFKHTLIASCAVGALAAGAANAGASFEFETHYIHTGEVGSVSGYAESHMLRMGVLAFDREGEDGVILHRPQDGERGTLYVEDDSGEIITIDGAEGVAGMPGMGGAGMGSMGGMGAMGANGMPDLSTMPGLTDEQRAQMEAAMAAAQAYAGANGAGAVPGAPNMGAMGAGGGGRVERVLTPVSDRSLEEFPNAAAYDVTEDDRLRYTIYVVRAYDVPGGEDIAMSFEALAQFMQSPAIPAQMSDGMWVFNLEQFGGRLPVAIDEYGPDGEVMIERRMVNNRAEEVDDELFEPFVGAPE